MTRSRAVAAVFIVANALTAGSIFCFPLFGPKMASDLGLSLTQTNTIWSAAVVGQYASAAVLGWIADTYGPRPVSMLAAVLFGAGYLLMARTERDAIYRHQTASAGPGWHLKDDKAALHAAFAAMAAYFVLVGAGVAASVFSALRSSTAHFKSHPGLALSIPLTLFSLSSLFLSAFASLPYFTDPVTGDLDSPKWLATLGAALMVVNFASAFGLSVPETRVNEADEERQSEDGYDDTENTPLLDPDQDTSGLGALPYSTPSGSREGEFCLEPTLTLLQFLRAPATWILAFALFAAVGGAEMIMSSVGSMVVSLKAGNASQELGRRALGDDDNVKLGKEILALRMRQVQLLAIANTIARLAVGFISDLLAPAPKALAGAQRQRRASWQEQYCISRITLLIAGLVLLCITFIYCATLLDNVDQLWLVSLATGTGYGLTFTLVPSIIICVWPAQFGRNYGLLTYAAALGSLCFSILFARINDAVAESHAQGTALDPNTTRYGAQFQQENPPQRASTAICTYGRACFQWSFVLAAIVAALGALVLLPLWRVWRRHL